MDIFIYLVEKNSIDTEALDAYNFVLCGHVQDIEY